MKESWWVMQDSQWIMKENWWVMQESQRNMKESREHEGEQGTAIKLVLHSKPHHR